LQEVASNAGWLIADKVIQIFINLFVGVWVARYLGPEQRGIMTYATALVSLFVPVSALGLGGILIREIVREPDAKEELMGTVFALQVGSYLLILPLIMGTVAILRPGAKTVQWAVAIVASGHIFATSRIFGFWFRSQLQSKYEVLANRCVEFMVAGAKIFLIMTRASLMAFIVVTALQLAMRFASWLALYLWTGEKIRTWQFSSERAISMLKSGWPLIFSFLSITIHSKIDNVMLGQIMGDRAVGIYGEAARFATMWYLIPAAVASSAYPELVRAKDSLLPRHYQRRTQQFFDVLSIIGYVSALPVTIAAPIIVNFLYGTAYHGSGDLLAIYAWTFIFVSLKHGMDRWLMAHDLTKFNMWVAVLGTGLNVLLNCLMIPKYGVNGAVWSTVIANGVALYFICLLSPKLRPLLRQLLLALVAPFRLPFTYL
jgi:PST family polysaccharide transporter